MLGPIFAIFIALASPTSEEVHLQCMNPQMFINQFSPEQGIFVLEVVKDARIESITDWLRENTNALDDATLDPDTYIVLAIMGEPIAMLLPTFRDCLLKPIYINLDFYKKLRGEKA